ncbi:hypothetical protein [Williamsia sp. M5A3_1d]
MTDPHSTIPEHAKPALWRRYEDWRLARYERSCAKNAHRWPTLRNRRSFRRLVIALAGAETILLASAVVAIFSYWFFAPFVISIVALMLILGVLRTVTGSIIDAPVGALDEIQLAQRNSARSIGYFAVFSLSFIPYFVLIFMGSAMDLIKGQNVYGIGVLLIALMVIGVSTPTMLTAWWMADPDPEDFGEPVETTASAADQQTGPTDPPPTSTSVAPTPTPTTPTPTTRHDPPTPATW